MSVLMNEIEQSRIYYQQAAEETADTFKARDVGMLWDRARNWVEAARVYEAAGDFERAAECFELLEDTENHKRCQEQAKALKVYEERNQTNNHKAMMLRDKEKKSSAGSLAKKVEQSGDLFLTGLLFRDAEQWMEAAICFEKIEEWERCSKAFEKAGLGDRADLVKMKIERAPQIIEPLPESAKQVPVPKELSQQTQFVPVYQMPNAAETILAAGNVTQVDPKLHEELAEHIREGNFQEAAACAVKTQNWLMAGAMYEHCGDLVNAANTYRQIGRMDEAVTCLERADYAKQAAMLSLSIGKEEQALMTLLNAVDQKNDYQSAMMLMELLIKWERYDEAFELLFHKLAPGKFYKEYAEIYYRVGRLFEKFEAYEEALRIYKLMIEGGAISDEINQRMDQVVKLMNRPVSSKRANIKSGVPVSIGAFDKTIKSFRENWVNDEASLDGINHLETREEGVEEFHFIVPRDLKESSQKNVLGSVANSIPEIDEDLSLFGVAADTSPAVQISHKHAAKPDSNTENTDPFAKTHRYELLSEIAKGGMGIIYEALDTVLGRKVALKLLIDSQAAEDEMKQFLIEARAIARLKPSEYCDNF